MTSKSFLSLHITKTETDVILKKKQNKNKSVTLRVGIIDYFLTIKIHDTKKIITNQNN